MFIKKKIKSFNKLREMGYLAIFFYLLRILKLTKLYDTYYCNSLSPGVYQAKNLVRKKILSISNNFIISGYYKSTYLHESKISNQTYLTSQLIGCYEQQVQEKIIEMQKRYKLNSIINFGSGNGFHVLGLIKNNFFKNGHCFELDKKTRDLLTINVNKNQLHKKISIYGEASFEKLDLFLINSELKKTIFLIDIEGSEFDLINIDTVKYIKNSYLIIENHEYRYQKKYTSNFWNVIKKNFDFEFLHYSARNPFEIKELNNLKEDEKWLAVTESRPSMNWIVCVPRNK